MKNQNDSEQFIDNQTNTIPWLYDINTEDTNWIITSAFMIFTMQTGKVFLHKIFGFACNAAKIKKYSH